MNHEQSQAEAFAAAIDRLFEQGAPAALTGTEQSLLDLAYQLWQTAPSALIDPRFRVTLRQRLLQSPTAAAVAAEERYTVLDTAMGTLHVAYRGRLIRGVGIATDDRTFAQRCLARHGVCPRREIEPPTWLVTAVRHHLEGRRIFKGAVDLLGLTPFQRRVLAKVREIPRGEVRPYTWVAREIGFPRAVRAVGTALGKNPIPLLIPCHRVIRSEGSLGAYSAGGTALKERLLSFEGVDLPELQTLTRLGKRFRGSRNTRIFCLPTCYSRKWAKARHTVFFASATEARQAGYRPCKLCRPA
jgi:methylated-DNA-[protein]-cysteine S-methyltransferase